MKLSELREDFTPNYGEMTDHGLETLVKLAKQHCKIAIRDDIKIYRGIGEANGRTSHEIDTKTLQRRAVHGSNFHNELIDNLKAFDGFPKRSKSLICTTALWKAESWALHEEENCYRVFPFDNAKIGVCPTGDILGSLVRLKHGHKSYTITHFNADLKGSLKIGDDSFDGLKHFCQLLKDGDKIALNKFHGTYESATEEDEKTFFEDIEKAFTPRNLGLEKCTAATFNEVITSAAASQEVWIEGKALMIQIPEEKEFMELLNEAN